MSAEYEQLLSQYKNRFNQIVNDLNHGFAELERVVREVERLNTKVEQYRQELKSSLGKSTGDKGSISIAPEQETPQSSPPASAAQSGPSDADAKNNTAATSPVPQEMPER